MTAGCTVEFFCVTCGDGRTMLAEERPGGMLHLTCESCGEQYDDIPREAVERFEAAASGEERPERTGEDTGPGAAMPASIRRTLEEEEAAKAEPSHGPDPPAGPAPRNRQTVERARALAKRHDLPLVLALRVVEGQMSLARALEKVRAEREASRPAGGGRKIEQIALIASIAALSAAVGLILGRHPPSAEEEIPPPPAATSPAAKPAAHRSAPARSGVVEIAKTSAGELAGISAPTPEAVLAAFCRHAPDRCQEAVGIGPTLPIRSGLRLGLYISRRGDPPFRAIQISRHPDGRGWQAGDGKARIPSRAAPDYPDGVVIHKVRPSLR